MGLSKQIPPVSTGAANPHDQVHRSNASNSPPALSAARLAAIRAMPQTSDTQDLLNTGHLGADSLASLQEIIRVGAPAPGSTSYTDALMARLEAEIEAERLATEQEAGGN
jgi:hypothetical protein